jgi:hypothetical protein
MTRIRPDGGITGTYVSPTLSSAGGMWTLKDIERNTRTNTWPIYYGSTDKYFPYTTLLIHGDGTNGANNSVFLDSSTVAATITRSGSTTQGTFTPFSTTGWSNYFNGSTDYFTTLTTNSGFDLSTPTNWTMESWVYPTANQEGYILQNYTTSGATIYGLLWSIDGTGSMRFGTYNGSSAGNPQFYLAAPLPLNTWTHAAIVRNGSGTNNITMYMNGVAANTGTYTTWPSPGNSTTYIGARNYTGVLNYWPGYISNLRAVIGTSLYSSNFTPSTSQLTAIANTTFLMAQSNRFIASNSTSNSVTLTIGGGTPQVQPFSPFIPTGAYSNTSVGGSMYNGSTASDGLVLSAYNTSTCRFTGDFTVECWFYMNNTTGYQTLFTHRTNSYVPILVWIASGTLTLYMSSAGASWDIINTQSLGTVTAGQWYHYALVRNGTAIKSYLNGVVVGAGATSSATLDSSTLPFRVGATTDSTPAYFNGYISNVRMVNGTAVYTSGFTPPTSPLTAVANTTFLLSSTNAGIFDQTQKNDLTTYGSAAISTTQSKFGGSSILFNGSTDYLTFNNFIVMGTQAYTMECWFYLNSTSFSPNFYPFIGTSTNSTSALNIRIASTTVIRVDANGSSGTNFTLPVTLTTGVWYHVAVTRDSAGNCNVWLNGVVSTTGNQTISTNYTGTTDTIGYVNGSPSAFFNGYIDEFRLTRGYARYTANFTTQTTAFLNN